MAELLHLTNARIWTADDARPWASSLTIRGRRVEAIDQPVPPGAEIIDLGGRVVTPGLIDAHVHMLLGGHALRELDLSRVRSRDAFEEAIARRHAELADGEWLIARGWHSENWPSHEEPDKSWLRAAGDRPVVCHRMDHHASLVNDAALAWCERYGADFSRTPAGGRISRDAQGEPTGLLVEAAAWQLLNPHLPQPTLEQQRDALRTAEDHLLSLGVTSVGSMEYGAEVADVFEPVRDALRVRVFIMLLDRDWPLDFTYGESFENDDHLAVVGYKSFIDGTLGSRTARLLADYDDDPGNRGLLLELAEQGVLNAWAREVADRGFQPVMHAIGDEAARRALDAIEHLDPSHRARIEHAQQLALDDLPRFAQRIASMQPLHRADDARYAERRLGRNRLNGTFVFRSLKQAGATLAFGSDWPIVTCDPIPGMRAAITGLTLDDEPFAPEQCLSVEETLRAYTVDAAYACRADDRVGTLREGMFADLVAFDRDPFSADWPRESPRIVLTIADGRIHLNRLRLAAAPTARA